MNDIYRCILECIGIFFGKNQLFFENGMKFQIHFRIVYNLCTVANEKAAM